MSPEARLAKIHELARQRDEVWLKILGECVGAEQLNEAVGHCSAIEGHEKSARFLAKAFGDTPMGAVLEYLLKEIDTLRTPRTERLSDRILNVVADDFELTVEQIRGPSRTSEILLARYVVIALLRRLLPELTLRQVAHVVGRTDHSTMMNALQSFEEMQAASPELTERVYQLERLLRQPVL